MSDLAAMLPFDENSIGALVLVLIVLLSTGYVYLQQLQPPTTPTAGGAHANARTQRGGNAPAATARGSSAAQQQLALHAVATAGLTDEQLRLHRALPSRHGARTVTICADALLTHVESAAIAWQSADAAAALADLLQLADVYVLCVVRDAADSAARIRAFVTGTTGVDKLDALAPVSSTRRLAPHKLLFCTTAVGKVAFVRQLEPQLHIDVDAAVVRDLEKHVPRVLHVTAQLPSLQDMATPASSSSNGSSNHHVAESVSQYFKLLRALGASP